MEAAADAEAKRSAAYWLAPCGWLTVFSCRAQDHQPRSGLGPLKSTISQSRKCTLGFPTNQSVRDIFSIKASSSQMTPAVPSCQKLTSTVKIYPSSLKPYQVLGLLQSTWQEKDLNSDLLAAYVKLLNF